MLLANGVEQIKHAPKGWRNVSHAFKRARTRKTRLPSAPPGVASDVTLRAYAHRYVSHKRVEKRA